MSAPNDNYDPKQVAALSPESLQQAIDAASAAFEGAPDLDALHPLKAQHIGDRAPIALARREIGALPPQAKADAGKRVNQARQAVQAAYDARLEVLTQQRNERVLREETVDVTMPTGDGLGGARHPITTVAERIADVFIGMGYEVAEGPEADTEWHVFDALNTPRDHPARSLQDTIFLDPPENGVVLRTHTSSGQIRSLLTRDLPVYVVVPGRVYRDDPMDATHLPVFNQVEGLAVDKGLSMAHLRGTLDRFAQAMFGDEAHTRLRPHFFPFTEPSVEVDVSCFQCGGTGELPAGHPAAGMDAGTPATRPSRCGLCKGTGWIEILGSGMIDPNVLRAVGRPEYDPERVSGFAFGLGIERVAMLQHGVPDLRLLYENDLRVLERLA